MHVTRPWRATRGLVAVLAAAALFPTACTGSGDAEPSAGADDGTAVTTSGAFGSSEITAVPQRVFALSPTDADMLLSIGVEPIAIPYTAQIDAATGGSGMYPWQKAIYPADTPRVEVSTEELNVEAIAATEPDLIVGTTFFGLTQETYDKLSSIAPVVHFDTEPNADAWQDSVAKIGEATGHGAEASEAVADAEASLAGVREAHPELEGVTYNAIISPTQDGFALLCSTDDNLARVMTEFGMVLSDYATGIDCAQGKAMLGWENLANMDADVLWAIPDTTEQMSELDAQALWAGLPAVQRDAVVVVPKTEGVPFALAFPSPLSLVWAADQFAPLVSAAVAKN
ncbi:ABC transporter substrate-binding protein [Pseudoclavibacter chungangensis]|uniref:ABC transporter substrate-binding protein n=1 Tax=Pseudoclavibacter chungangensis TaxID=587635 RepID=A0A7J5BNC5_9MICO|nr:ABC transporter substrate-binding protein [Pseudoclavibacter chungangensis]KAB1653423.1 ABC transporter substrate-binding protein [Pseudoclavibacter chungangensis]KAB1657213.1 ABC transporter substrate-binding protein [Pseudoclavibacter chungangensis]NYJ66357.1 iron complex transport system substrate-binding protein [Pseudoclavibacter chungangensis]